MPPSWLNRLRRVGVVAPTLAIALGAALPAAAQTPPANKPIRSTHVFAKVGQEELVIHVFQPAKPTTALRPAVIAYHAGGWVRGEPNWMFSVAEKHVAEGRVALVPQYRFASGKLGLREVMDDACRALKWTRDNAAMHGIDPQRIAAQGNSAGGQLAAIMAVQGCRKQGSGGSMGNGGPDALLLWSAPLDLVEMGWVGPLMHGDGRPADVSPVQQIKGKIAPAFLVLGEMDVSTTAASGVRFCQAAKKHGSVCEANLYKGLGHLLAMNPKADMSNFNPDPAATADAERRQSAFLRRLWPNAPQ